MPVITSLTAALGATGVAGAGAATAAAGTGFSLSSALSFGSSIIGGLASLQASSYQRAVAEINAGIADDNAKRAIEISQIDQLEQDNLTAAFLGEQLADQSASGIAVESGSFQKTRAAGRRLGRKDALNVRAKGEFKAHDFKVQKVGFENEARAAKSSGSLGLLGSFIGAGKSLASRGRATRRSSFPGLLQ